jgi:hypothetical protein
VTALLARLRALLARLRAYLDGYDYTALVGLLGMAALALTQNADFMAAAPGWLRVGLWIVAAVMTAQGRPVVKRGDKSPPTSAHGDGPGAVE